MHRHADPPYPDPEPQSPPAGSAEAALDVIAAVLRALAETVASGVAASERLEAWARHVLVLAPSPEGDGDAVGTRDWQALRRSVVAHIREERGAAAQSITDLQDVVWLVIEGLSRAMVEDAAADTAAARQLAQLRAATAGSPEALRAMALETVERVGRIIEEKRSRQRELAHELGSRVDVLRNELEDTRRDAETDALTELGNRAVFERELARAVQVHALIEEPACLLMIDVDGFKQVNDRHGHPAGDEVLRAISRTLVMSFPRRSDVVTRYGGDEFAVILRDATAVDGERLADRLLASVRDLEVEGPREPVRVTVSVGVAEAQAGETADAWLGRADAALYSAKAGGRDVAQLAA
jgi:diguanylate cyclase (GGDEF)-like protein